MAEGGGRSRGLFRRQRDTPVDPSRPAPTGPGDAESSDAPRLAPTVAGWDGEDDLWDDEVWPDPAPKRRGARRTGEMFDNRAPRTSPWDEAEIDTSPAGLAQAEQLDAWVETEPEDSWDAPATNKSSRLRAPRPEREPGDQSPPTRVSRGAKTAKSTEPREEPSNERPAEKPIEQPTATANDAPAVFPVVESESPVHPSLAATPAPGVPNRQAEPAADLRPDLNEFVNVEDLDDTDWEPVGAPTSTGPSGPDLQGPVVADGPVVAEAPVASPVPAPPPLSAPSEPEPQARVEPTQEPAPSNALPSWTGYRPNAPKPTPAPVLSEADESAPPVAPESTPTTMLSESRGVGPFDGGGYLTNPDAEPPDSWRTDEEELSLAGTAAAAEMVASESGWDNDEAAPETSNWSDDPPLDAGSDGGAGGVTDGSRVDYGQLYEPRAPEIEPAAAPATASFTELPRGVLITNNSWANLVTTSGLCLAVVGGIWQLLAMASGVSGRFDSGTDFLHKVGAGLARTGPVQGLVLLVAAVLVALPSFFGDRNARTFDDAAGTALGICAASAILGAIGAVMTFRYGIHIVDTNGQVTTAITLSLLSDLVATAGVALAAFATALMALRTRR